MNSLFRQNLRVIIEETRKMWRVWWCYKILLLFWAIFPLLWVLPFVFQGKAFVGGLASSSFKNLTGPNSISPIS